MYRKLMPSGLRDIRAAEGGSENPFAEDEEGYLDFAPTPPPPIRGYRAPEPRRVAVPALDNRRMAVVNIMEAKVLEKLDELLDRFSCCRCDRCKKDIVALALDKLPSKYMVLAEGESAPEVDEKTNAQIVSAMIQAVIRVRAHPRH